MKLEELKVALIQQFFKDCDNGVDQIRVAEVFESLSKRIGSDISQLSEKDLLEEMHSGNSNEPSKAFRKFTEGRRALLTINEDDGRKTMSLFAALRVGTDVVYCDLTKEVLEEKTGDLMAVKQALKQAKNRNDEVYFNIQNDDVR